MSRRKKIQWWVQALFSALILFMLFRFVDFGHTLGILKGISPPLLAVVVLLPVPAMLVRMYRWKLLYDNAGHHIPFNAAFKIWAVGKALNMVLPATSGDVLKGYFGYRWSGVKERMLTISLLDKLIALASVILLGVPFALIHGYYMFAGIALAAAVPLGAVFALPFLRGRIRVLDSLTQAGAQRFSKWIDLSKAVKQARVSGGTMAFAFGLSVLGWVLTYVQLYVCFQAVRCPVPLPYVFAVAPLLTLIRLFPFTLNGLGSDEATIVMLFGQMGSVSVTQSAALAAGLLYRVLLLVLPGILGAYYLMTVRKITTDKPAETPETGSSDGDRGL